MLGVEETEGRGNATHSLIKANSYKCLLCPASIGAGESTLVRWTGHLPSKILSSLERDDEANDNSDVLSARTGKVAVLALQIRPAASKRDSLKSGLGNKEQ